MLSFYPRFLSCTFEGITCLLSHELTFDLDISGHHYHYGGHIIMVDTDLAL